MRFPKVLLVSPYYPGRYFGGVRPPIGIGYIEEYLQLHGVKTSALDMNLGLNEKHLMRKVEEEQPDIVGFSVVTYQYRHPYKMCKLIKERWPHIKIVMGGAHVSAREGAVLNESPYFDYAIAGEGEMPMRDLCLDKPLDQIGGLYYRGENGEIKSGGPRQYLDNLDSVPFPKYASYPLDKYAGEIEINTSRGCPFKCIFCAVASVMTYKMRYRSAQSVIEELEYFYHRGIRQFQICDDNFLANRKRVDKILDAIEEKGLKGLVLRCGQGIRADLLTREMLVKMMRAGFKHLGIGVESADDEILKVIKKNETLEEIENGIRLACELDFDVSLLFIVGSPKETMADVKKSMELAKKYPVMKAFFFNLIPFPGTELYEYVHKHNLLVGPYDELINRPDELKLRSQPFFWTPEMSIEERVEALKMTQALSFEIQMNTLRRKLEPRVGKWPAIVLSRIGQSPAFERFSLKHRRLRMILDRIVFGMRRAVGGDQCDFGADDEEPGKPVPKPEAKPKEKVAASTAPSPAAPALAPVAVAPVAAAPAPSPVPRPAPVPVAAPAVAVPALASASVAAAAPVYERRRTASPVIKLTVISEPGEGEVDGCCGGEGHAAGESHHGAHVVRAGVGSHVS